MGWLVHELDAFLGQGVNADKFHLLLASGGLRGEVSAVRTGIVVGIDKIHFIKAGKRGFHLLSRVGFEPFHVGAENNFEVRAGNAFEKTAVPVLAGRGSLQAHQFNHVSFAILADLVAR